MNLLYLSIYIVGHDDARIRVQRVTGDQHLRTLVNMTKEKFALIKSWYATAQPGDRLELSGDERTDTLHDMLIYVPADATAVRIAEQKAYQIVPKVERKKGAGSSRPATK